MAERVYLITVMAHGVTSSMAHKADDLLDAAVKARKLQADGFRRIEITLTADDYFPSYPYLSSSTDQEAT